MNAPNQRILFVALIVSIATTAHAGIFSWIDSGGGNFNDPLNWSPNDGPPEHPLDDVALFDLDASYTVQLTADVLHHSIDVTAGTVDLRLWQPSSPLPLTHHYNLFSNSTALKVSSSPGAAVPAKLILNGLIFGSDPTLLDTLGTSTIGFAQHEKGILEIRNNRFDFGDALIVGDSGEGTLYIDEDSRVFGVGNGIAEDTAIVGRNNSGSGNVTIDGRWNANRFTAGYLGDANITLNDNPTALLGVFKLDIAAEPGSDANITVHGSNFGRGLINVVNAVHVGGGNNVDNASDDDGGDGTLNIFGGEVRSKSGIIGSSDPGSGTATVNISANGATRGFWRIEDSFVDSEIRIRGSNTANLNITGGGILMTDFAYASDRPDTTANILVEGNDSELLIDQDMYLGGDDSSPGGSGNMTISNRGTVEANNVKAWDGFNISINDGSLIANTIDLGDHDSSTDAPGDMTITDQGSVEANQISISDNYHVTVDGGSLVTSTLDLAGHYTQPNAPFRTGLGQDFPVFNLIGGTLTAPEIEFLSDAVIGYGMLAGDVIAHHGITATGDLTLGDPDSLTAIQTNGSSLVVGTHTVTLHQKGFVNIRDITMGGGTLAAPNGLSLGMTDFLSGSGTISARVAAGLGSTIQADGGDFALGDPISFAGFTSDGELYTLANTVTLHDRNEAVVGSLTVLGDGDTPGKLVAANGLLVNFGNNVIGYGTVDTPDDSMTPLINNGFIGGDSPSRPLRLDGYVTGVGSFSNVVINGTLAPAGDADILPFESVVFTGSSTLRLRLAEDSLGTEHDQIQALGDAEISGAIEVIALNNFEPQPGNRFRIVTAGGDLTVDAHVAGERPWPHVYILDKTTDGLDLVVTHLGDMNGDGLFDAFDVAPFELALANPQAYMAAFPGMAPDALGDFDGSGTLDAFDVDDFESALAGGGTTALVSEPAVGMLLLIGLAGYCKR